MCFIRTSVVLAARRDTDVRKQFRKPELLPPRQDGISQILEYDRTVGSVQRLATLRRVLDTMDIEAKEIVGTASEPSHVLQRLDGEAGQGNGVGFVESVRRVGEECAEESRTGFELDCCSDRGAGGGGSHVRIALEVLSWTWHATEYGRLALVETAVPSPLVFAKYLG